VTPRVIQDLVRAATRTSGSAVVQQFTVGLRSILRYLRLRGVVTDDLVQSVPTIAHWRLSELPQCLSPIDVERVVNACGHDGAGRRDRAVLLLLARLALRAQEVACLSLDDFDWRAGVLNVKGKGGDRSSLPLSVEVGTALADYLRRGRPASTLRFVFLSHFAPHGPLVSSSITAIASRAIHRAGLRPSRLGAHVFRHSLATRLLGAGASLAEVGQVLRHRHEDTTRLYAKVDVDRLRSIAPAWPAGAP
jgi:site-specific recombinase XerD